MNVSNNNTIGLNEYIGSVQELVYTLYRRVQKTQENIKRMRSAMASWARLPVLCRKDNKKDTLLALEDRVERFSKRLYYRVTCYVLMLCENYSVCTTKCNFFRISESYDCKTLYSELLVE